MYSIRCGMYSLFRTDLSELNLMYIFEYILIENMFSKACEYDIKASIYIAQQSLQSKRTNLKAIAKAVDSPEAFTAKILQKLVKDKILDSVRGTKREFLIEKTKIDQIKLGDIVYIIH
ncbi:Rrf2 family transcriptional regulator [Aquimarina sp. M1]